MALKLNDAMIKTIASKGKPGKYADGFGLTLLKLDSGTCSWIYRYKHLGKEYTYTLANPYPVMGLQEARLERGKLRSKVREGINPSAEKKKAKLVQAFDGGNTFEAVSREWFKKWQGDKVTTYTPKVLSRLETYLIPFLGRYPMTEITAPMIIATIEKIEAMQYPETAKRCYRIVGQIFAFAIVKGICTRNTAKDIKPSDFLKPQIVKHHPRVSEEELPKLLNAIDKYQGDKITILATQLLALTFVRTKELIEAEWSEVDFEQRLWTIPAHRMKVKGRGDHLVPLSNQSLAIFRELHKMTSGRTYILPSKIRPGSDHMSNVTILRVLDRLGYQGKMTGHGFRGVASTLLHEQGYAHEHIEMQLAHERDDGNKVSGAYNSALYLPARAKMLQDWANHLESIKQKEK